ncbi:hypothetical protein [Variovorax sp. CF313]|nr:hypothetical protein [Variovorax sp. CF313]
MDDVNIDTTVWSPMLDGSPAISMGTEPGKGHSLEVVQQVLRFRFG